MTREEKQTAYIDDTMDIMPLETKNNLIRSWYQQTVDRMSDEEFEDLYNRHFGL